MVWGMIKKEWRELRSSVFIVVLIYLVLAGFTAYLNHLLYNVGLPDDASEYIAPVLQNLSPEESFWVNWHGSNLWQLALGYGVYLSRALYRGEANRGTLDALLAKPIGRGWYYDAKYLALLTLLFFVPTASTLLAWVLFGLIGFWLPLGPWLAALLQSLPALSFFFAFSVLIDLLFSSSRASLLWNILILVSLSLGAGYILPDWLNPYEALVVADAPNPLISLLMLGLGALVYLLGRWLWLRKEW